MNSLVFGAVPHDAVPIPGTNEIRHKRIAQLIGPLRRGVPAFSPISCL
jgi:hypothetical protein